MAYNLLPLISICGERKKEGVGESRKKFPLMLKKNKQTQKNSKNTKLQFFLEAFALIV